MTEDLAGAQPTAGVTVRDRYLFDTRGFLVLRGVLSAVEVAAFNQLLDELSPEQIEDPDERDRTMSWLFHVHEDFAALMDHEAVLPYLREFVDDKLRLDGAYALVKLPGEGVPLHARAQSPRSGTGWYHVHHGQITSGLTGVEWALTDMPPGTGGFRVVPGVIRRTSSFLSRNSTSTQSPFLSPQGTSSSSPKRSPTGHGGTARVRGAC